MRMNIKPTIVAGSALLLAAIIAVTLFSGCENDHSLKGDEFYLSPGSYRFVRTGDSVISIGAHGAVPPIRWSVSDESMGRITGATQMTNELYVGASAVNYERVRAKYGVNTVTARDARGWHAICTITVANGLDKSEEPLPEDP